MDGIRAGVTLMQDFCVARSSEFQSYIDYMAREEAQRNQAFQTFNVFHDYMENPEKSTGLFTATKDHLTMDEKKELKEIFQTAQDNESLMWQTVISFDNRWLEKNHVYDSKHGILDEKKLKEVARAAIGTMLEKEGMDLAVWTASFHYNTDNIHIHFATVEPYPTREFMMYQGQIERRGKFKRKNIEVAKSKVVNELMQTREINQKINQTIRRDIVKAKEQRSLAENPVFREKFLALYESLPNLPQNMITYNNSIMSRQRKQIDEISKLYLKTYHEAEYTELKALLKHQSELYSEAYGFGQIDRSYAEGKEKELLERLGNAVLREVKQYARSMKKATGQTMEEKEPSVGGWGMPGVGETPVFVSEEWKEDVKQNPISVELGEKSCCRIWKRRALSNEKWMCRKRYSGKQPEMRKNGWRKSQRNPQGRALRSIRLKKHIRKRHRKHFMIWNSSFRKNLLGQREKKLRAVVAKRKRTVFLNIRRGMKNLKNSKPI